MFYCPFTLLFYIYALLSRASARKGEQVTITTLPPPSLISSATGEENGRKMVKTLLSLSELFYRYLLRKLNRINGQHRLGFHLHYLFLTIALRWRRKELGIFEWRTFVVFLGQLYIIKFKNFIKLITPFDRTQNFLSICYLVKSFTWNLRVEIREIRKMRQKNASRQNEKIWF